MILDYSPHFRRKFKKFDRQVWKRFYKQAELLVQNLMHPSLRAKKYDEARGIWQARADDNVRFYFFIEHDVYILLDIRKHAD